MFKSSCINCVLRSLRKHIKPRKSQRFSTICSLWTTHQLSLYDFPSGGRKVAPHNAVPQGTAWCIKLLFATVYFLPSCIVFFSPVDYDHEEVQTYEEVTLYKPDPGRPRPVVFIGKRDFVHAVISHIHVKACPVQSHVRQFSWNWVGRCCPVRVTGLMWLFLVLYGC